MIFVPRTVVPYAGDPNYVNVSYGGKNKCIARNSAGFVLPNCTGYAWGRALEAWGECHLPTTDAENWYLNANKKEYGGHTLGTKPKIGSVMCWRKGQAGVHSDGAGHVAFVEAVNSDGTVTWSQSDYSGTVGNGRYWRLITGKPEFYFSGLSWQGYIYPTVEFDGKDTVGDPVERDKERLQVEVVSDNLRGRLYPSTSGSTWGKYITTGVYDILDTATDGGYVWYEIQKNLNGIGDNLWGADVGMKLLLPEGDDYKKMYFELLQKYGALEEEYENYKGYVRAISKELDALV